MHSFWSGVAAAGDAATAGSGAANAAWFARRAAASRGPRRLGALLLTLLFAAVALDAGAGLALAAPGEAAAAAALAGAPLLLANLAVGCAVLAGAGR